MSYNNNHFNAEKQRIEGGIMHLLGLSFEQYETYKLRTGRAFLQNYMPNYPALIDEILQKPNYWKWWYNHYLLRDTAFFTSEKIELINPTILKAMYHATHDPYTLANDLVVDSIIFEGSSINQKPTA